MDISTANKRNLTRENRVTANKSKPNENNWIPSDSSAAQSNAIMTNYVKAKIDKMQQKSIYRLWGDRDKMINHRINEHSVIIKRV